MAYYYFGVNNKLRNRIALRHDARIRQGFLCLSEILIHQQAKPDEPGIIIPK